MGVICVLFLLCLQLRLSFVSVLFDFNASLNDVAPVSTIQFPDDLILVKTCKLLISVICMLFLLHSPHRLSSVRVVFDFNASLSDVAPLLPIWLSAV